MCAFGRPTAPDGVRVHNPAFDVTPAELVTAIVSDRGVHRAPYDFGAGEAGGGEPATGGEGADRRDADARHRDADANRRDTASERSGTQ